MTQTELARRISVTHGTIASLVAGKSRSSTHLHKIARVLRTSPAFLEGETDNPDENAPLEATLPAFQHLTMQVALPSEDDLASMVHELLLTVDRTRPVKELALEIAKLLPQVLSRLQRRMIDFPYLKRHSRSSRAEVEAHDFKEAEIDLSSNKPLAEHTANDQSIFYLIEITVRNSVSDVSEQVEILAALRRMRDAVTVEDRLTAYLRTIRAAADHLPVLTPFIPALSAKLDY